MVQIKTKEEIELMRQAGRKLAIILKEASKLAVPGISTEVIDKYAELRCRKLGCTPAFKGYRGFPASMCISVNEECIHGIPGGRVLREGDIVGLDFGVIYEGWYSDSAVTICVGQVSKEAEHLVKTTEKCLEKAIKKCKVGTKLSEIGRIVQAHAEKNGYSVVREFSGHGIGKSLHESPNVLNYYQNDQDLILEVGMVLAIEPMLIAGKRDIRILKDGWTVVSADQSLSAHFEHTIAITENGPEILTKF